MICKKRSLLDKISTETQLQLNQAYQDRAKFYQDKNGKPINPSKVDPNALAQNNAIIQYLTQVQNNTKDNHDAVLKSYNTLRSTYGATGGEGGSSVSDSSNDNDTGDYSDPSNYLGAPGSDDNN